MSSPLPTERSQQVAEQVTRLLEGFAPQEDLPLDPEVQQAIYLARQLQTRATALQTPAERRQQDELDRMIQSPTDKATLTQLTDQAFRSRLPHRAADQVIHILDVQGIPRFFSTLDRTLLKGFQSFGAYLPGVAMPFVKEKMQHETANVVLPAEEELLRGYLRQRWQEGVRMNVNYLGEALLGEREAQRRLEMYLAALQRPEIEVVSVKISTIYSQISPLAREHTVGVLSDRLELLYRAAAKNRFQRRDGTEVPKFVYLDMEEYRDLAITTEVFLRTLDRPGLEQVRAGIALQAYVPDSFVMQQRITEWARRRVKSGGAPVTIRLVKGANMEMERVEASLRGWPQAPYQQKIDTDANFKRMLCYGVQPENIAAVGLGIASHNLFTLAYGLVLAVRAGALERVQFEMLEGMANHQRRALYELTGNMLLYAPACRQESFINAIGYLVRRLDENTGEENFLRYAFSLRVDSPEWQNLEAAFVDSFACMETVAAAPRRTQNRADVSPRAPRTPNPEPCFTNESDTDWSLPQNGEWAAGIVEQWGPRCGDDAARVPLVLDGKHFDNDRKQRESLDPSRPGEVVARYRLATEADVDRAVSCARADAAGWRRCSVRERSEVMYRVADQISAARGELMGPMLAEGGKTLTESDSEVSEAIDFCRFYAQSVEQFHELSGLDPHGKGVVVVVSPWNFPLAIPCGGVAAALAAGNTVILKPASDTVLIAYQLCECFWQAGVPKTALQFMPCSGATVGQQLVIHDGVDTVILTGGTETALTMLAAKRAMNLLAETGGKNATIVTALADRDLAIKNVLHSAFSHSGQKCSATSLLILEEEVYNDAKFRETLCDAVESLEVGSAWQLHTKVGPLIRPPTGDLERGLKELEPGESWAVMPRLHVDDNPNLVSPGVKWGVRPESVTHCTEFFGPLLGVMPARDLHRAIDLVNATGYGLTSGLESLDDREHRFWQEGIRAGNLYINRPTTGAIVLRQPFGGMGKSAVGPGIKAGGPNYVAPLMRFNNTSTTHPSPHDKEKNNRDTTNRRLTSFNERLREAADRRLIDPREAEETISAAQSYEHWLAEEFNHAHDDFQLVGEDNFRRYLPLGEVRVRVHRDDSLWDLFARAAASRTAGCRTVVSTPPELHSPHVKLLDELTNDWAGAIEFVEETDASLAQAIHEGRVDRLRYAHPDRVPPVLRAAAAVTGHYIADTPVSPHGRVELIWYFREQSLSHSYHRYGNLGMRSEEQRSPVE
jgi:RHH-type proline utilization regulon transcriptional repressor/proline dehydrogenase/delta 1-pyrroline-5-carboxylate dehydrogenase